MAVLNKLLTELFSKGIVLPGVGWQVLAVYCMNW